MADSCDVRSLARRQKRPGEPLGAAPTADPIEAARGIGTPVASGSDATGGIAWPLTEQPYTGSTYYQLTSSDGLFVFEYGATTPYSDGDGNAGEVIHLAP